MGEFWFGLLMIFALAGYAAATYLEKKNRENNNKNKKKDEK